MTSHRRNLHRDPESDSDSSEEEERGEEEEEDDEDEEDEDGEGEEVGGGEEEEEDDDDDEDEVLNGIGSLGIRDNIQERMEEEELSSEVFNIQIDIAEGRHIIGKGEEEDDDINDKVDEEDEEDEEEEEEDGGDDDEESDDADGRASYRKYKNRVKSARELELEREEREELNRINKGKKSNLREKYKAMLGQIDENFEGEGYIRVKSMAQEVHNRGENSIQNGKIRWYLEDIDSEDEADDKKSGGGRNVFKPQKKKKKQGGGGGNDDDDDDEEDQEKNLEEEEELEQGRKDPLVNAYTGNIMHVEKISTKLNILNDLVNCSEIMSQYREKMSRISVAFNAVMAINQRTPGSINVEEFVRKFVPHPEEYRFLKEKYQMWRSFYMKNYAGGIVMMNNIGGKDIKEFLNSDEFTAGGINSKNSINDRFIGLESDAIHFYMELSKLHCSMMDFEHVLNAIPTTNNNDNEHQDNSFIPPGWCTVITPIQKQRENVQEEEEEEEGQEEEEEAETEVEEPELTWPDEYIEIHKRLVHCRHIVEFVPENAPFKKLKASEIVLYPHKDLMTLKASECIQSVIYIAQNVMYLGSVKRDKDCHLEFEYLIQLYLYRISQISNGEWTEEVLDNPDYRIFSGVDRRESDDEIQDFFEPSMKWYQFASNTYYVLNCLCNSTKHLLPSHYEHKQARDIDDDLKEEKKEKKTRVLSPGSLRVPRKKNESAPPPENDKRAFYENMGKTMQSFVVGYLKEIMYEDTEPAEEFSTSAIKYLENHLLMPGLKTWIEIEQSNKPKDYWIEMSDRKKASVKIMLEAMPGAASMLQIYMSRFQYFVNERRASILFDDFIRSLLDTDFSDKHHFETEYLRHSKTLLDFDQKQFFQKLWKKAEEDQKKRLKNSLYSFMYICHLIKMSYYVRSVSRIIQDLTNYKKCMEKYVIKYNYLVMCDWDLLKELEYYPEPLIVQVDPVNYQVFYNGTFYDCNSDMSTAMSLWLMIVYREKEGMIVPPSLSKTGIMRTVDISRAVEETILPILEKSNSNTSTPPMTKVKEKMTNSKKGVAMTAADFADSDEEEDEDEKKKRRKINFDFFGLGEHMVNNPITDKGVRSKSGGGYDEDADDDDSDKGSEDENSDDDEETRQIKRNKKKKREEAEDMERKYVFDIEDMIQSGKFKGSMAERLSTMFGMNNKHLRFDGEIEEDTTATSSLSRISRDKSHYKSYLQDVKRGMENHNRFLGLLEKQVTAMSEETSLSMEPLARSTKKKQFTPIVLRDPRTTQQQQQQQQQKRSFVQMDEEFQARNNEETASDRMEEGEEEERHVTVPRRMVISTDIQEKKRRKLMTQSNEHNSVRTPSSASASSSSPPPLALATRRDSISSVGSNSGSEGGGMAAVQQSKMQTMKRNNNNASTASFSRMEEIDSEGEEDFYFPKTKSTVPPLPPISKTPQAASPTPKQQRSQQPSQPQPRTRIAPASSPSGSSSSSSGNNNNKPKDRSHLFM